MILLELFVFVVAVVAILGRVVRASVFAVALLCALLLLLPPPPV